MEKAWATRETVFSITFSVWAVVLAIAPLVKPSHRCSQVNFQMGLVPAIKYLLPRPLSNDLIPIVDLLLAFHN